MSAECVVKSRCAWCSHMGHLGQRMEKAAKEGKWRHIGFQMVLPTQKNRTHRHAESAELSRKALTSYTRAATNI